MSSAAVTVLQVGAGADLGRPPAVPPGAPVIVVAAEAETGAAAAERLGPDCRAVFVAAGPGPAVEEFVREQFGAGPAAMVVWP